MGRSAVALLLCKWQFHLAHDKGSRHNSAKTKLKRLSRQRESRSPNASVSLGKCTNAIYVNGPVWLFNCRHTMCAFGSEIYQNTSQNTLQEWLREANTAH